MSRFNTTANDVDNLHVNLQTKMENIIAEQGAASDVNAGVVLGTESAVINVQNTESVFQATHSDISESVTELLGDADTIAVEAATIIGLAGADLNGYHRLAMRGDSGEVGTSKLSFAAESNSFKDGLKLATEAFSRDNLGEFVGASMAFNVLSIKGDAFSEAFYNTVVLTPDQRGVTFEVTQPVIQTKPVFDTDGTPIDFERKPLLDAIVNNKLLRPESTKVVPVVQEDGSSDKSFVDKTLLPARAIKHEGESLKTSALKAGQQVALIGISQSAAAVGDGKANYTDVLDPRVAISNVYFKISDGTETSVVKVKTYNMRGNTFSQQDEGAIEQYRLNLDNPDLMLPSDYKDVDGADVVALAAIRDAGYVLRLNVSLAGTLNIETSAVRVSPVVVEVSKMIHSDGTVADHEADPAKALLSNITFEFVGYDVDATRANLNRRTQGTPVETVTNRYRASLGAHSPVAIITNVDDGAAYKQDALRQLAALNRIRTINNATIKLIDYAKYLSEVVASNPANEYLPEIEGVASEVLRPYYKKVTLDVLSKVATSTTIEQRSAIEALVVNLLRTEINAMLTETNYKSVVETMYAGATVKPKIILGTDNTISQYIHVSGDERTLADLQFETVTTDDTDVRGKIFAMVTIPPQGKAHPLVWGQRFVIPSVVSGDKRHRDGAEVYEIQAVPREMLSNNVPMLLEFEINNLEEATVAKITAAKRDA